jgi:hypothetical protein
MQHRRRYNEVLKPVAKGRQVILLVAGLIIRIGPGPRVNEAQRLSARHHHIDVIQA